MKNYLAFDFGATSGRAVIGSVNQQGDISLREIHRFPNRLLRENGHLYWNWNVLIQELEIGLRKAGETGLEIESVGIDTWGVDVLFIGKDGNPLGNPYAYRDTHTNGAPAHFFKHVMPSQELYRRTGIQVMNFNTLFQLYTLHLREDKLLDKTQNILFLPDAFNYWLTGRMATEYTIASTSQLLDCKSRTWDIELLHSIGLSPDKFAPMILPGTLVGTILPSIAEKCNIPQWPVIAVAGHDTASAIASLQGDDSHRAYLSSGTWSLLGVELKHPILSTDAQQMNITNEGGIDGKIRFLKNITGMWLIEGLRNDLGKQNISYSYDDITRLARNAECVAIINPDDDCFAAPESMIQAINEYCMEHHLVQPRTHGEYLRCVYESLARRYAEVLKMISTLVPNTINELHIIGGGSKNTFLNELTAKATGLPIIVGAAEATATGNIHIQHRANQK